MPDDVLIEAQSLGRRYRQGSAFVEAVAGATFRLRTADRIALVGRSGSGKSTLLHLMSGLDAPTSGTLCWPALGAPESLLPAKIALVFQTAGLLAPLTVSENVALPLLMAAAQPDTEDQVSRALATFGLTHLAARLPEELSAGQMQRVAMARAIAGTPRVLLADEPTGQLDRQSAEALLDALAAHLAGSAIALVIATHDPAVAARMDRIWRMERGALMDAA